MRFKFCGITRIEDAEHSAELGAWAIGINHWRGSRRYCDPATVAAISAAVRRRVEVVGVFVNPSLDEVTRAAVDGPLSIIQLHGDEGPAFCREVARRTGCRVIKALRVRSTADLQTAETYRVDFHLLDTHLPGMPGGTGEAFDWEIVRERRSDVPMILAGGLTPDNVGDAIATARPDIVDVASGIERAPGIKDLGLMRAFADQVRIADPPPAEPDDAAEPDAAEPDDAASPGELADPSESDDPGLPANDTQASEPHPPVSA